MDIQNNGENNDIKNNPFENQEKTDEKPSQNITLSDPELESLKNPLPLGFAGVFFFTAGMFIMQFVIMAVFAMAMLYFRNSNMPIIEVLTVFLMLSSSLIWAAAAFFLKKNLNLPSDMLDIRPTNKNFTPYLWYFLLIPLVIMAGSNLDYIMLHIFPSLTEKQNGNMEFFNSISTDFPILILGFIFMAVIVAPITEEIFFRGVLFKMLRIKKHSFLSSAVFVSILFSLIHMRITGFFLLFTVAMIASAFSEKSKTLFPSVLFHAFYNFTVIAISAWQIYTTEPEITLFSNKIPPQQPIPPIPPVHINLLIVFIAGLGVFLITRKISNSLI